MNRRNPSLVLKRITARLVLALARRIEPAVPFIRRLSRLSWAGFILAGASAVQVKEYGVSAILFLLSGCSMAAGAWLWRGITNRPRISVTLRTAGALGAMILTMLCETWNVLYKGPERWSVFFQKRQTVTVASTASPAPSATQIPTEAAKVIPGYRRAELPRLAREESPKELKLLFKASPLLTDGRKQLIAERMESCYRSLVRIGFNPPTKVPPIGTNTSAGSTYVGPGPIYWQAIYIEEKSVDNPRSARAAYVSYAFAQMLDAWNAAQPDHLHRMRAAWVFANYFTLSLAHEEPGAASTGIHSWIHALWDIRQRCGKDFTDRSLLFATKTFDDGGDKDPDQDFNRYFFSRLFEGMSVVDNNFANLPEVRRVLEKRRLLPPVN